MITKIDDCKIEHQSNIVLAYFVKARVIELFILFFFCNWGGWHVVRPNCFLNKNNQIMRRLLRQTKRRLICPDSDHWWPENQSLSFFLPKNSFFNPKYCRNRNKPIYDLKKPFQKSKSMWTHICFFMKFKEKKPNMNSSHQIEPFDTNFIRFDSLN